MKTKKKGDKISTVPLRNTNNKKTNKSTLTTEQRNTRSYICDGDIGRYLTSINEFLKILIKEIFI